MNKAQYVLADLTVEHQATCHFLISSYRIRSIHFSIRRGYGYKPRDDERWRAGFRAVTSVVPVKALFLSDVGVKAIQASCISLSYTAENITRNGK